MTIPTTTSNGPTLAPLQHIPSHERRHQRLPSITDLHLPRPFLMHPQGQQQQQQLRRGTPEATAAAVALMAASSSASRPQQPQPPNYLQHRPLGPISLPSTLQHSHFTHAPRRPSTLRAASASSFAPNRQGPYPVRHCLGRSASLVPLADATLPGGPLLAVPAPPAHDDNTGRPSSGDSSSSSSITSSITNSPRLVHTSSKGDFYMTDAGEIEILPRAEYTIDARFVGQRTLAQLESLMSARSGRGHACVECRSSRKRCERGRKKSDRCRRCQKKGLPCEAVEGHIRPTPEDILLSMQS